MTAEEIRLRAATSARMAARSARAAHCSREMAALAKVAQSKTVDFWTTRAIIDERILTLESEAARFYASLSPED